MHKLRSLGNLELILSIAQNVEESARTRFSIDSRQSSKTMHLCVH